MKTCLDFSVGYLLRNEKARFRFDANFTALFANSLLSRSVVSRGITHIPKIKHGNVLTACWRGVIYQLSPPGLQGSAVIVQTLETVHSAQALMQTTFCSRASLRSV